MFLHQLSASVSTDHQTNGITWFQTDFYIPLNSLFVDNTNLVGCTSSTYGSVFFSPDNGNNWIQRDEGLPTYPHVLFSLKLFNNYLYSIVQELSGVRKIWRRLYSEVITGVKNVSIVKPKGYQLYQNYPNPFNPKQNQVLTFSNQVMLHLRCLIQKGRL